MNEGPKNGGGEGLRVGGGLGQDGETGGGEMEKTVFKHQQAKGKEVKGIRDDTEVPSMVD